jgi:hypothetical protein
MAIRDYHGACYFFYPLVRRIGSSTYFRVNVAGGGYVGTGYYR